MKKSLIILALLFIGTGLKAQQVAQQSQYMLNKISLNPAFAGVEEGIPITFGFRRQWVGIDDAPVTQTLSVNAYTGKFMGIGLSLFNDVTGPTRRTGMNISFARHFEVSDEKNSWLSFGLAGTVYQYLFDQSKLSIDDPNDPAITGAFYNEFTPDAMFGVYYYSDLYYVGFSVSNLLETKADLFNLDGSRSNQVARTLYVMAAYTAEMDENFSIEPSFLFKKTKGAPYQLDINARIIFQKKFWGGVSYRLNDAIVGLMGLDLGIIELGYSYDYSLSDISKFSSGSHELILTVRLPSPLLKDDDYRGGRRKPIRYKRRR
ncbi:type IX secretion system membrane protein PorP/SprF [Fulvivirgaceae bacterium BMA10]|uniref:Type IX secretion system membrane protein PorP/SprF n=1 Tax=Splendidivirga corallicola TaxID=3051826 RepID=A0ABT8KWF3_9BACT|nr:type IX secretion system membrane protein PorP/SprF [Fulvivirgaceae bacterium BMA10]